MTFFTKYCVECRLWYVVKELDKVMLFFISCRIIVGVRCCIFLERGFQTTLGYTSSPLIVWVYLHSNFRGGLRKRMYFESECAMAVEGHPRSLILVPLVGLLQSAYMQLDHHSNLGPILPCFRDIAGFLLNPRPPLFHPK